MIDVAYILGKIPIAPLYGSSGGLSDRLVFRKSYIVERLIIGL